MVLYTRISQIGNSYHLTSIGVLLQIAIGLSDMLTASAHGYMSVVEACSMLGELVSLATLVALTLGASHWDCVRVHRF